MATYTRYDKKVLSDDLLIKKLKIAAKKYQQYVNKDILIVYARSKKGPFFAYEFHAGEENFQHLAGVKSPNGAVWFFNKCLDQKNPIERKDIVPKKDIKTTSSKINILPEAVDLTKAKAYKIGEKDLITLNCEFDIAIGNVPFGQDKVFDKRYKDKFLIHDYFFQKTLDKVMSGGIIAFITTDGTLDKKDKRVREYIAKRAEFLGAIRLPNNTFTNNANTKATSDIIFLKKRDELKNFVLK